MKKMAIAFAGFALLISTLANEVALPNLEPVSLYPVTNSVAFFPPSPQFPTVPIVYGVTNLGMGIATGYWRDFVFISTDGNFGMPYDSQEVYTHWSAPIPSRDNYWFTNTVRLPQSSGTYWLALEVNRYGWLNESDRSDNLITSTVPVTVTYKIVPPDLMPTGVQPLRDNISFFPPSPELPTMDVVLSVTNLGNGEAAGYWENGIYVSTNQTIGGTILTQLIGQHNWWEPNLPAGGMYAWTNRINLPQQSGTYWIIFQPNCSGNLYEENVSNNYVTSSTPIMLNYEIVPPDLVPAEIAPLSNSVSFFPPSPQSPTVPVNFSVANQGSGSAIGSWWDRVYVSTNETMDGIVCSQDVWHDQSQLPLAAQSVYQVTCAVTLPQMSGKFWLILQANSQGLHEEDQSNNMTVSSTPVSLVYQVVPPDLGAVSIEPLSNSVSFSPPSPQSPTVPIHFAVTNCGTVDAAGFWENYVFISTNKTVDGAVAEQILTYHGSWDSSFLAGEGFEQTTTINLPQQSGTYWLVLVVNSSQSLYEENWSNNQAISSTPISVTYQIIPPDLSAASAEPTSNNVSFFPPSPQAPTVPFVSKVKNIGLGDALGLWQNAIGVSTIPSVDGVISWQDFSSQSPIQAGIEGTETNFVSLPKQSGTYWLVFWGNRYGGLYEENPSNNIVISATPVTLTYQVVPPDLAPCDVGVSGSLQFYPASPQAPSLTVTYSVTNSGSGSALGSWRDRIYVSTNSSIDGAVSYNDVFPDDSSVQPGDGYQVTNTVALPQQSGTYWVFVQVNADGWLYEENLSNNVLAASQSVKLDYAVRPADLVPLAIQPASNRFEFHPPSPQPPTIEVSYAILNQGHADSLGSWNDTITVSTNQSLTGAILAQSFTNTLAPISGAVYKATNTITLPQQSGTYWLFITANSNSGLYEDNATNNTIMSAAPVTVTYQVVPPDLAPLSITPVTNNVVFSPSWYQSPTVDVVYSVTNHGRGEAVGNWTDRVSVSTNGLTNGIVSTQDFSSPWWSVPLISPEGVYWQTNTITLPTESGTFWLFFEVNHDRALYEENANDNLVVASAPVTVTYDIIPADLAPLSLAPLTNRVVARPPLSWPTVAELRVEYSVTNQGLGDAWGSGIWNVIWVSTNQTLDGAVYSQTFEDIAWSNSLKAGEAIERTNVLHLPPLASGTYWLILQVDAGGFCETNTSNDVIVSTLPFTFEYGAGSALSPISLQAPSTVIGGNPTITVSWGGTNSGLIPTPHSWSDAFYVSTNPVFDATALMAGWVEEYGPIFPGACYWKTANISLPVSESGTYYLSVVADINNNEQNQLDITNRVFTVPVNVVIKKGAVQVVLEPQDVVGKGASWRIDGGDWGHSGAAISNLVIGAHELSFSNVDGWASPGNRIIHLLPDQLLALSASYSSVQSVAFPDTNLEAAVRSTLQKPDGPLSTSDMLALTNLDISSKGISNLVGLEMALNLVALNASGNQIRDISPILQLFNLQLLDLSSNPSNDYSTLGGLTNLSSLALNSDYLTNIDFVANLTGLASLSLSDNAITNIVALSSLGGMQSLELSDNPIGSASPLSKLTQLHWLMLNNASIDDISFITNSPNLISLGLNQNSIVDPPPLATLRSLVFLGLYGNQLTSLDFVTNLTGLDYLDIQNNQLTDISALENVYPMYSCSLAGNCVDINDGSPAMQIIQNLTWRVYYWPQHGTPIINVPSEVTIPANRTTLIGFRASDYTFHGNWLDGMTATVDAPSSGLTLSPILNMVEDDWLWRNWLVSITPATNQIGSGLIRVTVTDKCFSSTGDIRVTVEWPTNVVFADFNLEQAIRFALNLPKGDITSADLKNLTTLQAKNCAIINLSGLEWAVNLTNLDLSGNYISDISPLSGLTNLQNLNLATNSLTRITALSELPQVLAVDVSDNWVDTSVGSAAWNTIESLLARKVTVSYASQSQQPGIVASIGDAVEAPNLQWVSGGNSQWFVETQDAHNGTAAAQSGAIADSQSSWLSATVTGPTTLRFWWKVSSENNYDLLQFSTNGVLVDVISGQTGWQQLSLPLAGGNNVLTWCYSKDRLLTGGHDAGYLDHVVIGDVELAISINAYGITPNGHFQFGIWNPQGKGLEIQACTNLTSGIWTPVGTITNQTGQVWFIAPDVNAQEHFFRVKAGNQ